MKQLGNWFIPDSDNPEKLKMVLADSFQCEEGLLSAFKFVKSFNTAIDVGSWIGDSTVLIANKFKNVKVFEPNISVLDCCKENLKTRNISNCEFYNVGLSNITGKQLLLNKAKTFSGWISTVELSSKDASKTLEVNTSKLDDFNFKDIDFIKIDVDSHEGFLLEGAINFFKTNNPVIMIESKIRDQQRYQNKNMPAPLQLLKNFGYTIKEKHGKADYILTR
jgi:FkbM family methyltransferase